MTKRMIHVIRKGIMIWAQHNPTKRSKKAAQNVHQTGPSKFHFSSQHDFEFPADPYRLIPFLWPMVGGGTFPPHSKKNYANEEEGRGLGAGQIA